MKKLVVPYFFKRSLEFNYRPSMPSLLDSKDVFPARLRVYDIVRDPYGPGSSRGKMVFALNLGKRRKVA